MIEEFCGMLNGQGQMGRLIENVCKRDTKTKNTFHSHSFSMTK